jgi:hypothetical protein
MLYTLLLKITVNVFSRRQRDASGRATLAPTDALSSAAEV